MRFRLRVIKPSRLRDGVARLYNGPFAPRQRPIAPAAALMERSASTARTRSDGESDEPSEDILEMQEWYGGKGGSFRDPIGTPNYLGPMPDQPFPLNPHFRSQPVLDEDARDMIWKMVVVERKPLKVVSAHLSVDIRRVAAVVRMKEIERRWVDEGKPLARPYAMAVMSMLPKTSYSSDKFDDSGTEIADSKRQMPKHEPINDVTVHPYTMQQLFVPTSESRDFTREDAAKAFHETLKSADERVPHPELVVKEKDKLQGLTEAEAQKKYEQAVSDEDQKLAAKAHREAVAAEQKINRVSNGRFEFRFQSVNSDVVGRQGRHRHGVGHRYGAPLQDRKRGISKIPKSVP